MGKGKILVAVIVLLVIIILAVCLYFVFKKTEVKPVDSSLKYLIKTSNESNNDIIMDYIVISNKTVVYNGKTNINSWDEFNLSENISEFEVIVYSDEYYSNKAFVAKGTKSIDITNLQKIGNVWSNNFSLNKNGGCDNITFYTDSHFRGLAYCALWGTNIVNVIDEDSFVGVYLNDKETCEAYKYKWIETTEECGFACKIGLKNKNITLAHCSQSFYGIEAPSRLRNRVIKCWYPRKHITKETSYSINLCYNVRTELTQNDYIRLTVFDTNRNIENLEVFEGSNGEDVGAKDYVIEYHVGL